MDKESKKIKGDRQKVLAPLGMGGLKKGVNKVHGVFEILNKSLIVNNIYIH